MIRNAQRRKVLFVVVFALVCMMGIPIGECDDYAFLLPGAASAQAEGPADKPAGTDHQRICSCIVCVLTTADTFMPRLPAPERGELVAVASSGHCSSPYSPGIFRPPIA